MKWLILKSIEMYWVVIPDSFKGICLFKESCSRFVYRKLKNDGFIAGIQAFFYRFSVCRKPFTIVTLPNEKRLILNLCNGDHVDESSINPHLLEKSKPSYHTNKR